VNADTDGFLEGILRSEPGSPDWILYAAAAFDSIVERPQILVGGGAQVFYTQQNRPTDIDMVGRITARDMESLAAAGFKKQGRHWYYGWEHESGVLVEVPSEVSYGVDTPYIVFVSRYPLRVISLNDLMMDRLVQATDNTDETWDEAVDLARYAGGRVDWELIRVRCAEQQKTDIGLRGLPRTLDDVLDILGIGSGRAVVDYDALFAAAAEVVTAAAKGVSRAAMFGSLARREHSRKETEVGLLLVWPDDSGDETDLWMVGMETAKRVGEVIGRPCVPWVYTETELSVSAADDPELSERLSEGSVDLPIG